VEADPGLVGQGGDPLRPQHRRKGAKQAGETRGRQDRHAVADHLPQGTWEPWTATIGTTATPGSGKTWAAWSASNDTARKAGASE
jgi:hypothetical protein